MIFGDFLDAVKSGDRIASAFVIRHAGAITRKCDDVGHAGLGRERDIGAERLLDGGVIFYTIKCLADFSATSVAHGANQAIAVGEFVLLRLKQVDSAKADLSRIFRELFQGNMRVAPLADRLVDATLTRGGLRRGLSRREGQDLRSCKTC